MRPRILVLSVLDPIGQRGLSADVRSAIEFGVDAVPVATGVISRDTPSQVRPTPARLLAAAVNRAFEQPVDGMLLGPVHGYWQSRVVARALDVAIPETLVLAPIPDRGAPRPSKRAWRTLRKTALPVTTVAVLPQGAASEMLDSGAAADAHQTATAALDAGAHAAWLTADDNDRRVIDVIALHGHTSVLDYPPTEHEAMSPGAPLAALLALGVPLQQAIDRAHRAARGLGDRAYVARAR